MHTHYDPQKTGKLTWKDFGQIDVVEPDFVREGIIIEDF